jgi:hypothetical protein
MILGRSRVGLMIVDRGRRSVDIRCTSAYTIVSVITASRRTLHRRK